MTRRAFSQSLSGVFSAVPTPFKSDGAVDFESLQANLEKWNRLPLAGYLLGGSNGEYVSLSPDERVEMVRVARSITPGDRLLIAGSGMESTRETIVLTRRMGDAGADAALVVTPHYFKKRMTPAALEAHFRDVATVSPVPILLYNVPANTGVELPAATVISLATRPNIVGLKDSSGDVSKIGYIAHKAPESFTVLAGSAGFFLPALAMGARGMIGALANIAASRLALLLEAFQRGDVSGARAIQLPLIAANAAVTARFGVPGLKAALDMLGFYGGPVRAPLQPLTDEEKLSLKAALTGAGLL